MAVMKLGNVNACGFAVLYDAKKQPVARCLDTPNAIAVSFKECPEAASVLDSRKNKIQLSFGKPGHLRKHYTDRFNVSLTLEQANFKLYV